MNKKFIAIITALALVVTLLAPVGVQEASAATSYSAVSVPTIESKTGQTLGILYVKLDPVISDSKALISLPSGFDISDINVRTVGNSVYGELNPATGVTVTKTNSPLVSVTPKASFSENEFELVVNADKVEKKELYITITGDARDLADGEVEATIQGLSGQLTSGKVTLANVGGGEVTIVSSTPEYITGEKNKVTLTVTESFAGALKVAGDSIKLTLPRGFSWHDDSENSTGITPLAGLENATIKTEVDDKNDRVLLVDVARGAGSAAKGVFRIEAFINVDDLDAKYGDVEATVAGKSNVKPGKLLVAKYQDFGIKLSANGEEEVLAGRSAEDVANIVIEETAPSTLVTGRTVNLTLPTGAKWANVDDITFDSRNGLNLKTASSAVTDNGRTLRLLVDTGLTTKAGKVEIKDLQVNTAPNFKGDITVKVSGNAGVSGDVTVGTVKAPIEVSVDAVKEVKVGVQAQEAGTITIKETEAEALIQNRKLEIVFPYGDGVSFDATPKVNVTEGDIEVKLTKSASALTIEIENESTEASTIEISGITYIVSRAFPEGKIDVAVRGAAIDEVNYDDNGALLPEADRLFPDDRSVARVTNATVVTPAPGDSRATVVFTIDSTNYVVNGVETTMDVAPYIKDSRTFLPVFFVAQALGVDANNIIWEPHSKTVTVIKGDRVAQMQIGSKTLLVNGTAIQMDTAPEIKDGRTMLPIFFVGQALGASVEWDGDTREVTVTQ